MGMMNEPSPSIDEELDDGGVDVVEREDTQHVRLFFDDMTADAARANISLLLQRLVVMVPKTISIVAKVKVITTSWNYHMIISTLNTVPAI